MIEAKYIGNTTIGVQLLQLAREERKQTRQHLAASAWRIRARLKRKINTITCSQRAQNFLQLEKLRHNILLQSHSECLQVALDVAREILACEVKTNTESIRIRIAEKLEELSASRPISVRINPSHIPELAQINIPLIADSKIAPGDIQIDTASGKVEIQCATHLATISQRLHSRLLTAIAGEP